MQRTLTTAEIKSKNRLLTFEKIDSNQIATISEISRDIGLSIPAVTSSIDDLLYINLIKKLEVGKSKGGRPPVEYSTDTEKSLLIGIQFNLNSVDIGLLNLEGKILKIISFQCTDSTPRIVARMIIEGVSQISGEVSCTKKILAIGVSVHGYVDRKRQDKVFDYFFKWDGVDFKNMLEEAFDYPVFIIEESNACAFGELKKGDGRKLNSFIFLYYTEGIGGGFIGNKTLVEGADGLFGEIGHMSIDINGEECYCGNRGCWETYSKVNSLTSRLEAEFGCDKLSLEDVTSLLRKGDLRAINIFDQFCEFQSIGILNAIHLFNPDAVFIGGKITEMGQVFQDKVIEKVMKRSKMKRIEKNTIRFSRIDPKHTALIGAAVYAFTKTLLIDDFFKHDNNK
ncbi:MAG: ROK family protein [Bacteroidetes bacterium]|nr:ROK family protein [Bacteroidota bacterium]